MVSAYTAGSNMIVVPLPDLPPSRFMEIYNNGWHNFVREGRFSNPFFGEVCD